jgi:AraC family transcriptional regulator of arabinose operon
LFKGNNSTPALESLNFNKSKIDSYVEDPKITSLFYDIISTLQGSDPLGNYSASSLLYQLLVLLYQNFQSNHGKEASLDRQIMEPVMEYIKRNFIRTITLNDLAQIAKVTPQHLCTVFKGSMKMRPMEYITRKRLQESKRMLLETDLPVKEIAESVGYIDNNYFGVLFKKQEGITPGQYRGNNPSQDSLSTY